MPNIEELKQKRLIITGKTREILKRPESRFTVRVGNRLYVNKELFDEYLVKCAKYQIDI